LCVFSCAASRTFSSRLSLISLNSIICSKTARLSWRCLNSSNAIEYRNSRFRNTDLIWINLLVPTIRRGFIISIYSQSALVRRCLTCKCSYRCLASRRNIFLFRQTTKNQSLFFGFGVFIGFILFLFMFVFFIYRNVFYLVSDTRSSPFWC
jgi:hypothetical protein